MDLSNQTEQWRLLTSIIFDEDAQFNSLNGIRIKRVSPTAFAQEPNGYVSKYLPLLTVWYRCYVNNFQVKIIPYGLLL